MVIVTWNLTDSFKEKLCCCYWYKYNGAMKELTTDINGRRQSF